jgi:hypothetical protein
MVHLLRLDCDPTRMARKTITSLFGQLMLRAPSSGVEMNSHIVFTSTADVFTYPVIDESRLSILVKGRRHL